MRASDKPLVWLHGEVKTPPFSEPARIEAGMLLRQLQRGERLGLPHSRPMPSIGVRCNELRIVDRTRSWRIIYRTDPDAVVIAAVFAKTTPKTPPRIIAEAKRRLRHYDLSTSEDETMRATKVKRLTEAGWRVGSAREFLGLSAEEAVLVEMRLALSASLRVRRERAELTQAALAKRVGSSQSRVAKMEAGDPTVSIELLIKA
ncbi:MAG TPA: XRE family transcriptional regulator, partial [Gemmatimonadaceae bacterium]|nr:XRE family transcriptional regulator [Gemmatimonadaceae bacterium]